MNNVRKKVFSFLEENSLASFLCSGLREREGLRELRKTIIIIEIFHLVIDYSDGLLFSFLFSFFNTHTWYLHGCWPWWPWISFLFLFSFVFNKSMMLLMMMNKINWQKKMPAILSSLTASIICDHHRLDRCRFLFFILKRKWKFPWNFILYNYPIIIIIIIVWMNEWMNEWWSGWSQSVEDDDNDRKF